jgi:predicted amidophosphoribosyltransferase
MQIICCETCGGDLDWDEDLCPKCLDRLQEGEWIRIIRSLEPSAIVDMVRSLYPDFDQLDGGWGL